MNPEPRGAIPLIDGAIARNAILVGLAFVACQFTPLDFWVEDRFYDFTAQRWLIDERMTTLYVVFHEWPKLFVIGVAIMLALFLAAPPRWRTWRVRPPASRRVLLCALLTVTTIPASVALGKKLTNTFCPMETRRYGGDVCLVRVLEPYPEDARPTRRGECFPAAHASGGFALIGLCSLARRPRTRRALVVASLGLGSVVGLYQMARGAHFLSHTIVSLGLALLIAAAWRRALGLAPETSALAEPGRPARWRAFVGV